MSFPRATIVDIAKIMSAVFPGYIFVTFQQSEELCLTIAKFIECHLASKNLKTLKELSKIT